MISNCLDKIGLGVIFFSADIRCIGSSAGLDDATLKLQKITGVNTVITCSTGVKTVITCSTGVETVIICSTGVEMVIICSTGGEMVIIII